MILVADASALIALATCDSLVLLDAIFGNVLVPNAVYAEVTESDKPQSARLRSYLQNDWFFGCIASGQTGRTYPMRCASPGNNSSQSGFYQ